VRTDITSPEANQKSQRLRASIDAIAVGSGTVIADDPLLTARECYRERPLVRVIFDRRLRTPPTARVLTTLDQGPVLIIAGPGVPPSAEQALTDAGARILSVPGLRAAMSALIAEGVMTLLVEGGPTLHRAFAEAGLVDRVHLVVAPHVLGEQGVKWLDVQTWMFPPTTVIAAEPRGADIWIEADVHRHR
jgi:diaminohydroxyphosphoribosylaminopyrimidine deaminase/5-amino-6-(5-phosphoribosylamino)uracil reductase